MYIEAMNIEVWFNRSDEYEAKRFAEMLSKYFQGHYDVYFYVYYHQHEYLVTALLHEGYDQIFRYECKT